MYLQKCVDSILAQTFQDFELLLVDDGSPDNCGKICDEYAKKDDRIIVIHKENGGLSDARNAALDRISGKYVTFIDSDDYVTPEHLNSLYTALIATESDMSVSNITMVNEDEKNDSFYKPTEELTVLSGKEVFDTLYQPCACAKLYKSSIFESIRYPVNRLYEDVFVYHDILSHVSKLALTGENTYFYLIRDGSIIHQEYRLSFTDIIDAVELRIKKLEELGLQELADENRPFIYSRVAVAFANLDDSVIENKKRLGEIKDIYDKEYSRLMETAPNNKQKFRYWLLYHFPNVHTKLFGKNMSLVLG